MTWLRSEEEVEEMIKDMINRSKGRYITQGVSFSKTCPRQLDLLKKSLMSSASFSGLAKELLALRFNGASIATIPTIQKIDKPKAKDVGNFL